MMISQGEGRRVPQVKLAANASQKKRALKESLAFSEHVWRDTERNQYGFVFLWFCVVVGVRLC